MRLSGAVLSTVDDRYVRGLINFVASGQIRVIQKWDVSITSVCVIVLVIWQLMQDCCYVPACVCRRAFADQSTDLNATLQAASRIMTLAEAIDVAIMEDGPVEISKWGEYHGQLLTKSLEPGKPPTLQDGTVEVEAGQKIVISVNDASPYATMMYEVLVGEESNLAAFFVVQDGQPTINVRLRDFDANRNEQLIETVRATVSSSRGAAESEELLLIESGPATGIFSSVLPLVSSSDAGNNNDGHIRGLSGDILNISYTDLEPAGTYSITRAIAFAATADMPRPIFAADRPIFVTVVDADLNQDRGAPDVAHGVAFLKVLPSGDTESLTLVETADTSSVFTGQIEARLLETACCTPLWLQGLRERERERERGREGGKGERKREGGREGERERERESLVTVTS